MYPAPIFGPPSATLGVGRDDLVSGEAVALALPPASIWLRMVSCLIDVVVVLVAWFALRWISLRMFGDADQALRLAINTVIVVLVFVGIPTASETVTRGKTLGHAALGLRTVRDDAGPIGFRHAISRALLAVVEIYGCFGVPAFLAAIISRKGKRFGDMLAGTYVIRDRQALKVPAPIPMPPELAMWARGTDLGAIPDMLAIAIRQFMTGATKLKPEVRSEAAGRLLASCLPFVAPRPPYGAPAEMVLAAIMAERRERDAQRLIRDEQLRRRLLG